LELLLNALREGLLAATAGGWRWDPAAVRAHLSNSEVAGLLAARATDAHLRLKTAAIPPYRLTGISLLSRYFLRNRGGAQRQLYAQGGTCPDGAVEKHSAAHCLGSVLDSDQAGAAVEVGTADAIVAYGDVEDAAGGVGYNCDIDD